MSAHVDVLAVRRWVAEHAVSDNGMHEIREGAVNERERPLIGYAATCEQARAIADAHNTRAAVAELIEAAGSVSAAIVEHYGNAMGLHLALAATGGLNERLAAALARVKGAQP